MIPRATYRLQLHRGFTFRDATAIVPYLAALGISHVYCSPYLRARPGSTHGYDIVDHATLNPEIGDEADFDAFNGALRTHGLRQLLDIVPNHMGVMGADNDWWLDVLENGEASPFAAHFDIDWQPADPTLAGRVLLPVLGDHYGAVLERGELKLGFEPALGRFSVRYYEHLFPIDPGGYPTLLQRALGTPEGDALAPAARTEVDALCASFATLPSRGERDVNRRAARHHAKLEARRRLAAIAASDAAVRAAIEAVVSELNGRPGEPHSFDPLHALLEAQAWHLAFWRVASDQINYRRFFDINDLAALRMEDDAVFDATHERVLSMVADGTVDGLRIDHPDGLYDPAAYFARLQSRCGRQVGEAGAGKLPIYLVVEKITAGHERLPDRWPVHGTTGYRFANVVNGLFVDPDAKRRMDRVYRAFTGQVDPFEEIVRESRMLIMQTSLASELTVLTHLLTRIARADRHTRDYTPNALRQALIAIVSCFPVYRTYIADRVGASDRRHVGWAVGQARKRSQTADRTVFDFVENVLLDMPLTRDPALARLARHFARKFQQFTSPVAAKGVEDTALYRFHRLVSLNEVGGDPDAFGLTLHAFHGANRDRARHWPHTMLATSTHDNKRAEDVRTRIDVLSEIPAAWRLEIRRWRMLNRSRKRRGQAPEAPSANDEYLLYQILVGSWPQPRPEGEALEAYRERIVAYMTKAVREAKQHTSWVHPDTDYEQALGDFVRALLSAGTGGPFLERLESFVARIAPTGRLNSLAQTAIKLTAPGVPDFYQGTESWTLDLVDPDNRRPVDYALRRHVLDDLKQRFGEDASTWSDDVSALLGSAEDGRVKLWLTWRGLQLRQARPALFERGDYVPIPVAGELANRVCAFARTLEGDAVITVVPRLVHALVVESAPASEGWTAAWADTRLEVPDGLRGRYRELLTGATVDITESTLELASLLRHAPLAILARAPAA